MKGTIAIVDLEVACRIGVPDSERSTPQRLMMTLELELDLSRAATTDDIAHTVDYDALAKDLRVYCAAGEWRLLEKLAADIVARVVSAHRPLRASLEIKKFVLPQTRHVSVRVEYTG